MKVFAADILHRTAVLLSELSKEALAVSIAAAAVALVFWMRSRLGLRDRRLGGEEPPA